MFVVEKQTDDVDDEKKEQGTITLTSYTVLAKQQNFQGPCIGSGNPLGSLALTVLGTTNSNTPLNNSYRPEIFSTNKTNHNSCSISTRCSNEGVTLYTITHTYVVY